MASILVCTSSTGETTEVFTPEAQEALPQYFEEFCFICGRPTDHAGEHEGAVTTVDKFEYENYVLVQVFTFPEG